MSEIVEGINETVKEYLELLDDHIPIANYHMGSVTGLSQEIYNNRKEIGLFTLDDIEIDEDKIRKALRDMPFLTAIAKERRDECRYDIAKAIAKKKPIQVKK